MSVILWGYAIISDLAGSVESVLAQKNMQDVKCCFFLLEEKEHTWNVRARQFLDILDEIENNEVVNENVPAEK